MAREAALAAKHSAPPAEPAALARVEPQLRELMSLAARAGALPAWSRSLRLRRSGPYLSRLRGRGMEYDESRPYQPGDDIRQLDWRVTARSGRPHTKLFREERERPIFLCVDFRHAMYFATRGVFKAVQAARLAAVLAWRAQQVGDRVGGVVFGDRLHHELPPRRGQAATIEFMKTLAREGSALRQAPPPPDDSGVALAGALTRLRRVAKPGSLAFVVSDWRGFDDAVVAALVQLAMHSDVAVIAVNDPLEAAFPALDGAVALADGRRRLELSAVGTSALAAYAARHETRLAALRSLCRERRLLFAQVDTSADPVTALMRLLSAR